MTEPSSHAHELIADEEARDARVVELARLLSIAVRVEPELLRAMRVALMPRTDASLEADLWFSPLVQARAPDAMVLLPDVADQLRRDLSGRDRADERARAWEVLRTQRRGQSPLVMAQERITYYGLTGSGDDYAIAERELGRLLASLERAPVDDWLPRWVARMLPRLPEVVRMSEAAAAVAMTARVHLGGVRIRGVLEIEADRWHPGVMAELPRVEVGVRLMAGGFELSVPPAAGAQPMRVPSTRPLVLDIELSTTDGAETRRVILPREGRQVIAVTPDSELRATTLSGTQYAFRRLAVSKPLRNGTATRDRSRREPSPRRAARLMEAVRRRLPDDRDFEAQNERFAASDPRLALQSQVFLDIDRGHTPTLHHLCALAAASGWSFEAVCREIEVDFAQLPRLQGSLGRDRTWVDRSGQSFSGSLTLPADIDSEPGARHRRASLLGNLVPGWHRYRHPRLFADGRYLTAQIGRRDNLAYPRLPSGAAVLVDPRRQMLRDDAHYYVVEHPNGVSCARASLHAGELSLLSEDRDRYPRLDFAVSEVRLVGRAVAFAGRVDRLEPPAPVNLGDLIDVRRPLLTANRTQEMSSPALLRDLWARRGLSFRQFERKARMLRRLTGATGTSDRGRRFSIGRGYMHDLLQADASSDSVPRLETLFALSAIFLKEPATLLRGYGVPIERTPSDSEQTDVESSPVHGRLAELASHPLGVALRAQGWDLTWLLDLKARVATRERVFHLPEPGSHISSLLLPDAFVVVNPRQRRILTAVGGRPVETLRDWERPLYLLHTDSRHGYVCGYIEQQGDRLHVIPHPDAPSQRVRTYRQPDQAVVLGRISHVATLLP